MRRKRRLPLLQGFPRDKFSINIFILVKLGWVQASHRDEKVVLMTGWQRLKRELFRITLNVKRWIFFVKYLPVACQFQYSLYRYVERPWIILFILYSCAKRSDVTGLNVFWIDLFTLLNWRQQFLLAKRNAIRPPGWISFF